MKLPSTPPADDLRYLTERLNSAEAVIETLNADNVELKAEIEKLKGT